MKYLKKYELKKYSDDELPKNGDYILIHIYDINKKYMNFINNTIGKVVDIDIDENEMASILVLYNNIPQDIINDVASKFMYDEPNEYLHEFNFGYVVSKEKYYIFGDTPEEIYLKIDAKKYNL